MTECQPSGCINKSGEGVSTVSKGKKIFKITNATKFPTKRELAIIWLHYIGTGHSVDLLNLIGKSFVKITLQNSRPISKMIETFIAIWWGCLNKTFERRPPLCQHNSCTDIKPRTRSCHSARSASNMFSDRLRRLLSRYCFRLIEGFKK